MDRLTDRARNDLKVLKSRKIINQSIKMICPIAFVCFPTFVVFNAEKNTV